MKCIQAPVNNHTDDIPWWKVRFLSKFMLQAWTEFLEWRHCILSQLETVSTQTFEGPTRDTHFGTFCNRWSWMVTAFPPHPVQQFPSPGENVLHFSQATEIHALLSSEHSERFDPWHQHQADFIELLIRQIFAEHLFCARLLPWNGCLPQEWQAVLMLFDQTPGTLVSC